MALEPGPAPRFLSAGVSPHGLRASLPRTAAERLRILELRAEDARSLIPIGEDVRLAGEERTRAGQDLRRITTDSSLPLHERDPRVIEARRRVAEATEAAKEIQERYTARGQAAQPTLRLLSNVMAWLRSGRPSGTTLRAFDGPRPAPNGKETPQAAVARLRDRAATLKEELDALAAAPLDSATVKKMAVAQIEEFARAGRPDVAALFVHGGEGRIRWPERTAPVQLHNLREVAPAAIGFSAVPDVALVAWLHKDALIEAVTREIDAAARDDIARPLDREVEIGKLVENLLLTERAEAAATFRAWSDGLPVPAREDISPLALLDLMLVSTAAVARTSSDDLHAGWPQLR
jgi:hypothetical protein